MAGTIVSSTISDGTNSTSTTNCIRGSAKAWLNFNGTTTPVINGSFNVSSVTRASTGNYTVNFTTAMPNTTYSFIGSISDTGLATASSALPVCLGVTQNTTSVVIITAYTIGGAIVGNIYNQTSVAILSS
jgi:hypothetical protein